MSAQILDGKALADQIQEEIADEVAEFIQNNATVPTLAAILVGEDPASKIYFMDGSSPSPLPLMHLGDVQRNQ